MKSLFQVLPEYFFKPLTSKYRKEYADCIMLIFNTFKPEISYGVNREVVVRTLEDYRNIKIFLYHIDVDKEILIETVNKILIIYYKFLLDITYPLFYNIIIKGINDKS